MDYQQNADAVQQAGTPCGMMSPGIQFQLAPQIVDQMYQLANHAMAANQDWARVVIENDRLKNNVARKQAAEDAYSQTLTLDGSTYTQDLTGRLVELMNRQVEWAFHVIPQPPSELAPFYQIKLKQCDNPLKLTEKQFMCDTALIQVLQELGVRVTLRRSAKTTAVLLRKAIDAGVMVLPYYGGWQKRENGTGQFLVSRQFSTHQGQNGLQDFVPLPDGPLPASSISRFQEELKAVANLDIRWLLSRWFHCAALTSLLDQLGYPLPLALCLDTTDAAWNVWTTQFFNWYGDSGLSLDTPPQTFSKGLLCRKDQPLLVLDQRKTTYAAGNSDVLEQVINTRQVLWKVPKGNAVSLPLQAQPVILSSAASSLTCAPGCLVVELKADDLNRSEWSVCGDGVLTKQQYLMVFLNFVRSHIPRLREILEKQVRQAMLTSGDRLNEECAQALGVLLAVDAFLSEFTELGAGDALLFDAATEERIAWLTNLLEQASWKAADGCGLAERFVAVARAQLDSGVLCACPTEYERLPPANKVYYDAGNLYFTRDAFGTVCAQLNQSRPVVLKALREANLLCGKPINDTTTMTRTSIWNAYGIRTAVPVYRMPREAFDRLGDPLVFPEEVQS